MKSVTQLDSRPSRLAAMAVVKTLDEAASSYDTSGKLANSANGLANG